MKMNMFVVVLLSLVLGACAASQRVGSTPGSVKIITPANQKVDVRRGEEVQAVDSNDNHLCFCLNSTPKSPFKSGETCILVGSDHTAENIGFYQWAFTNHPDTFKCPVTPGDGTTGATGTLEVGTGPTDPEEEQPRPAR